MSRKSFITGIIIVSMGLGICGGAYHLYRLRHPRKILVAVDTSFSMKPVWHQVPDMLEKLGNQPYAEFCLVTEKRRIHNWQPGLKSEKIFPYAPRNFSNLLGSRRYLEIDTASEKILITNAAAVETQPFSGWKIIHLMP